MENICATKSKTLNFERGGAPLVQFYGLVNRKVIDYPSAPSTSLIANLTENNAEISMGEVENPNASSNTNLMDATMDTSRHIRIKCLHLH